MSAKRVADQELASSENELTLVRGAGERIGAALASPISVLTVVPGLVVSVGLFLTLLGQNALRESTTTLGRDRFAEQTSFIKIRRARWHTRCAD